jgi:phenol 2-monooxygenase
VRVKNEVPEDQPPPDDPLSKIKAGKRRAAITLDYIMAQAKRVFTPYTISIKSGTAVDWWAAYQIGQRMTSNSPWQMKVGWREFLS